MATQTSTKEVLAPLPSSAWDEDAARHLLRRVGFGVTEEDVAHYTALGLDDAVHALTHPEWTPYHHPPPDWVEGDDVPSQERIDGLRHWWLERMIQSPRPLEEKMTLFWHSHFATQADKVRSPHMVYAHNELLRRHGLDFFSVLVAAVARDPAMVRFLDLETSHKGHPNENFVRELMELYTLGEGQYTEQDVREAARAFTGWTIRANRFFFDPTRHDDGEKVFLGQRGPWGGADIINLIFEQAAVRRFLPQKLFSFLVYPEPEDEVVDALADRFHEVYFNVREWLDTVLRSALFYSTRARRTRIKSPIEYVVGIYRRFGVDQPPPDVTALALRRMGQELFQPPDVDGWKEGPTWINAHTLMMRYHFAYFCTTGTLVEGLSDRNRNAYAPTVADDTERAPLFFARDWMDPLDFRNPVPCVKGLNKRVLARACTEDELARWTDYLRSSSSGARVMFNLNNRMSVDRFQSAMYLMLCSPEYQVC